MSNETIIARRLNADGHSVSLWSDGVVSIPYVGQRRIGRRAAFMLLGDICLYGTSEFLKAAEVAKRAEKQEWDDPLNFFRNVMNGRRLVLSRNSMGSVGAISYRS